MENKFTKGQWKVSPLSIHRNMQGNAWVSTIISDPQNKATIISEVLGETQEVSEANAKLIAAAPDMLAALNNCVDELKARGFKDTCTVQIGLKAIQKATC